MSQQHQSKEVATPSQKRVSALLRATLPLPLCINEQYATTADGHRVSTAAARRFKRQVKEVLRSKEQQAVLTPELQERFRQEYLALSLTFWGTSPSKCPEEEEYARNN
jgi:hypothetical protein